MERHFLGLGSKHDPIVVKEEASDRWSTGLVPSSASRMQWSFSNKCSSTPKILSFETAQANRSTKAVHDPLPSSSFMTTSAAHVFNSNHKSSPGMIKKNMILDKQVGNPYPMTTYGLQHFNTFSAQCSQELKFPVSNQANQPVTVQNTTGILPRGGAPIMASPVSVIPATSSIIGSTELRNASKPSVGPSQLTIFYSGSVCVYDDISPEKAQAIMLLAQNGPSASQNKTNFASQVHASMSHPSKVDGNAFNSTPTTSSCLVHASPVSVASPISLINIQQEGGSTSTNGATIVKSTVTSTSSGDQSESRQVVTSAGSAATCLIPGVALPQARKASLARFLEKRKERVLNSSPYSSSNKSPEDGKPRSDGLCLSLTSAASSPVTATGRS